MNILDTIYVFVPDISIFRDAFSLKQETDHQKVSRNFLNFLANQSEKSGGFKYLRTPIEFTVKLLNDPLFNNTKIWAFLGLIMRVEPVFNKDVTYEKEIVECYNYLKRYKKPILISNDEKAEYKPCEPFTATQIMKFKENLLNDTSSIKRDA